MTAVRDRPGRRSAANRSWSPPARGCATSGTCSTCPATIDVQRPRRERHYDRPMWTYWCLQEGTLGVDPSYLLDNDGQHAAGGARGHRRAADRRHRRLARDRGAVGHLLQAGLQLRRRPGRGDAVRSSISRRTRSPVDPYGPEEHRVRRDAGVRADVDVGARALPQALRGQAAAVPARRPPAGSAPSRPDSFPVFDLFVENAYVVADSNHGYKMIGVGRARGEGAAGGAAGAARAVPVLPIRRGQAAPRQPFAVPLELAMGGRPDAPATAARVRPPRRTAASLRSASGRPSRTTRPKTNSRSRASRDRTRPRRSAARSGCSRRASPWSPHTAGDQVHGMTANAFMSVSLRPPLVVISVDRRAKMHALLHEGTRYRDQRARRRAARACPIDSPGRTAEGTEEVEFDLVHETPLVRGALAHLVARVVRSYWGGDHSLFVGQVEYARYGEGRPLLFQGGRYQHLLRASPRVLVAAARDPRHDHGRVESSGRSKKGSSSFARATRETSSS